MKDLHIFGACSMNWRIRNKYKPLVGRSEVRHKLGDLVQSLGICRRIVSKLSRICYVGWIHVGRHSATDWLSWTRRRTFKVLDRKGIFWLAERVWASQNRPFITQFLSLKFDEVCFCSTSKGFPRLWRRTSDVCFYVHVLVYMARSRQRLVTKLRITQLPEISNPTRTKTQLVWLRCWNISGAFCMLDIEL